MSPVFCDAHNAPDFASQFPRAAFHGLPGIAANDSCLARVVAFAESVTGAAAVWFFLRSAFGVFGLLPGGGSMP